MARPIHDAISRLVVEFVRRTATTGFVTSDEEPYVGAGNIGAMLDRSYFPSDSSKKKVQTWTKFPDAVITFDGPDLEALPIAV